MYERGKKNQNTLIVKTTNKQTNQKNPSSVKCIIPQSTRLCFEVGSSSCLVAGTGEFLWTRRVNLRLVLLSRPVTQHLVLRSPRPAAQDSGDAVCERKLAVLLNSQKEFWLLDLFWPSLSLGDLSVFMPRDRCLANAKHWRHTWRPGSILITSFLSNRNRGKQKS